MNVATVICMCDACIDMPKFCAFSLLVYVSVILICVSMDYGWDSYDRKKINRPLRE